MIFNCNPGCSGKRGTTSGLVDSEQDAVVCEYCGEILAVSSFTKNVMKGQGKIKKKTPKSFQFNCETCHQSIETTVQGNKLVGKECTGECKFNVSNFIILAMKNIQATFKKDQEVDDKSD